ncbi:MAG: LURP-one-related family protein [Oscillospiraceae bacterium]|jgi:uncharacterized protein YxjI|nr:LURP-one-related family protein [Oscillospiraceae bacterium]
MKLLFKQKVFSWLDHYEIYDEKENVRYEVRGELAWGHMLRIYDRLGYEVGSVKERVFTLLPKFEIYSEDEYLGCISKEFTLFEQKYNIDFNGWTVSGDMFEWYYEITDIFDKHIATVTKEPFKLGDTYILDIDDEKDALNVLMLVLAIDAEKASRG